MRLRYTPEARSDLRALKRYITVELCNPSAADSVTQGIVRACSKLKEQSDMGIALSKKTGQETDLRYIIIEKHLAFYRVEKDYVSIVRILDSRTDYLQVILQTNI